MSMLILTTMLAMTMLAATTTMLMPMLMLMLMLMPMLVLIRTQAVEEVPQSLVRELEGNDSMRSKFEALCRKAQNDICKQIEALDGEGKVMYFSLCFYC